jgi:hypothetical protein
MNNASILPPHLGGHGNRTHIDAGAVRAIMDKYGVTGLIDVGCGPMGMKKVAESAGLSYTGIDGDPACSPTVLHDFSIGPLSSYAIKRSTLDLVWCVEFLEHVDEKYVDNVFSAISLGDVVFITHALPGAGGYHHVNERSEFYWISQFNRMGYSLDNETTELVRLASTMDREFCRNTGKVFYRNNK